MPGLEFSSLVLGKKSGHTWAYPPARRSDHVDVYKSKARGEVTVKDPYQWLEEPSKETDEWVEAQIGLTQSYISSLPDRDRLRDAIQTATDYEKFSAPALKPDGRWYWYYNEGLSAQSVLYRSKDSTLPTFGPKGDQSGPGGEVFFDSNALSKDGTAAITTTSFSHDGKYFAYGVSLSGSDFFTIYVRPTENPFPYNDPSAASSSSPNGSASGNGTDVSAVALDKGRLPDEIKFVKFSGITWTWDHKGFFYQRFPVRSVETAEADALGTETLEDVNAELFYHRIGTPQSEDILVVARDPENSNYMYGTGISDTDNGKYLELYVSADTSPKNKLWIADLETQEIGPNMKWEKVVDDFEASYSILTNDGPLLYLMTNSNAPNYRVITLTLGTDYTIPPPPPSSSDFIPEDPNALLSDITPIAGDKWIITRTRNVKDEVTVYQGLASSSDSSSPLHEIGRIQKEFVGSIGVGGKRSQDFANVSLTGFTTPNVIGRVDFSKATDAEAVPWSLYRTTRVKGLVPEEFIAEQLWYTSKDGTRVPMFVVRHESVKLDGSAAVLQYGYGGFSHALSPFFSPSMLTFIKSYGAVLAVANIRGGNEFGESWHEGGIREKKINVFNDFIAASEHLVEQKYTSRGKIAINGGSNGGLLVAACVNLADEGLFGAAVAEVGVMDMLKFANFTIGKHWTADYGDPHVPEDFDFIYPYSPLHNVPHNKVLPPSLLLTADHDDRVVPLHSFKYAAELQHVATLPGRPNGPNPNPQLIRIDKKSGHGSGKSTAKRIEEAADKWAFVANALELLWRADATTLDQKL